jgi:hypothetical protein
MTNLTAGQIQEIQARGGIVTNKRITFTGAAGLGATGTIPLFTVTGQALVCVIAACSVNLAGATATHKVGNSGSTARYQAQVTATNIIAGDTIDLSGEVSAGTAVGKTPNQLAFNAESIIATIATAGITAGVLDYYCVWFPLSDDALVVAA